MSDLTYVFRHSKEPFRPDRRRLKNRPAVTSTIGLLCTIGVCEPFNTHTALDGTDPQIAWGLSIVWAWGWGGNEGKIWEREGGFLLLQKIATMRTLDRIRFFLLNPGNGQF